MAENESLNIYTPYGRRWMILVDAIRRQQDADRVVQLARQTLCRTLDKVLRQLAEHGVTLARLLQYRDAPDTLRQFLYMCQGHDYVRLFADVAAASSPCDSQQVLQRFIEAIWETVADPIALSVARSDAPMALGEIRDYVTHIGKEIEPDVQAMAASLAINPKGKPQISRGRRGQTAGTAQMLSVSLLGN